MQLNPLLERFEAFEGPWEEASLREFLQLSGAQFDPEAETDEDQEIWQEASRLVCLHLATSAQGLQLRYILKSEPVEDLDENALDALNSDMEGHFDALVTELSSHFGAPSYSGAVAGSPLTESQFSDLAACWIRPQGRVILLCGQQDTELPFQVEVVFAPGL